VKLEDVIVGDPESALKWCEEQFKAGKDLDPMTEDWFVPTFPNEEALDKFQAGLDALYEKYNKK